MVKPWSTTINPTEGFPFRSSQTYAGGHYEVEEIVNIDAQAARLGNRSSIKNQDAAVMDEEEEMRAPYWHVREMPRYDPHGKCDILLT